eukprot:2425361-Heterocapsa_arctica.AAC.1
MTNHGNKFILGAAKYMLYKAVQNPEHLNAHCYNHGTSCHILPKPPPDFKGLVGSAAGVSCIDWSSMGSKGKWLGSGSLPFLQWARERLMSEEDFCV